MIHQKLIIHHFSPPNVQVIEKSSCVKVVSIVKAITKILQNINFAHTESI